MDSPEIRAGTTVYFGVGQLGGLFALGDGHARQGQGELCGTAIETAMNTVVIVELLKGGDVGPTPWPRLETDEALMCTGSARPLEDAFRISQQDLVDWASTATSMERLDTYQLISQAGEAPVGNVCDPNYTMVAKIAKRWLPPATVYDGVHERLRSTAATYLSQR